MACTYGSGYFLDGRRRQLNQSEATKKADDREMISRVG